jgi:hypothetical protein
MDTHTSAAAAIAANAPGDPPDFSATLVSTAHPWLERQPTYFGHSIVTRRAYNTHCEKNHRGE